MIVHLRPTLPFREPRQIDDVIRLLRETGADCVKSVYREQHHQHKMWKMRGDHLGPYEDTPLWRELGPDCPRRNPGASLLVGGPRGRDADRGCRARLHHRRAHSPRTSSIRSRASISTPTTTSSSLRRSWGCCGRRERYVSEHHRNRRAARGRGPALFVIAEGGVNHNGDPALAKKLVRHRGGLQSRRREVPEAHHWRAAHALQRWSGRTRPEFARCHVRRAPSAARAAEERWLRCRAHCEPARARVLRQAPGRPGSADMLDALDTPAFKTPSAEC